VFNFLLADFSILELDEYLQLLATNSNGTKKRTSTPNELIRQLHAEPIEQNSGSIVTDSINTLPGNSSLNTAQHATIDEAVFSVSCW
jgi:hypothetical protein